MNLKTIGFHATFLAFLAFLTTACGHPKPNLTDQDVQAAITPCPNPVQFKEEGASVHSSVSIADGAAGTYRATTFDYYIDNVVLDESVHSTQALHGTVTRPSIQTGPQYSLGLTCKQGIKNDVIKESILLPDTIDRKTGDAILETESFTIQNVTVTDQTTTFGHMYKLVDYFLKASYGSLSTVNFQVIRGAGTSLDIVFKTTSSDLFSPSTLYGQIHYELDTTGTP